jgi:hypothetical protein
MKLWGGGGGDLLSHKNMSSGRFLFQKVFWNIPKYDLNINHMTYEILLIMCFTGKGVYSLYMSIPQIIYTVLYMNPLMPMH